MRPDRRLLARAAAARGTLAVCVATGVAGALLLLPQLILVAYVCAGAAGARLRHAPETDVTALVVVIGARAVLAAATERAGRRSAATVMSSLRGDLVEQCLRRRSRPPGTEPAGSGGLAAAAVQGVDGLEVYFARYLPQLVLAVAVPVAVLTICAVVDPVSAAIMLVALPVVPVFMVLLGRSAAGRARANMATLAVLSAHFLDVVRGLPTLRAFNRGSAQLPKIRAVTDDYRRATMATLRLAFASGVVLDLAATLSTALVAVSLGVRLVDGSIGLRPALTVLVLVPELYAPLRELGAQFHASADGVAAAGRILDVLTGAEPDATQPAGAAPAPPRPAGPVLEPTFGPVRLAAVTVRYPDRVAPALDRVDLVVVPGELLAVIGPSGAGKTTLGRVLLGLTRPDGGRVTIGGRPLDADRWRTRVGWAAQHPTLVAGTVAANIALGRPRAGPADVEAAARAAHAHGFVAALPAGYDTVVGPGGRGLSAGQRQRLGLARALLRDASLLVLDEPTAHLDPITARAVGDTIAGLRGSRTVVLPTHDLLLAARADRQVTLAAGRIAVAAPALAGS